MRNLALTATALFALTAVGSARAADMPAAPANKASAPPAPIWTGFYVGANVGYGWDSRTADFSGTPNIAIEFTGGLLPTLLSPSPKGWLGGGQLGYNWQFATLLVAGLEADLAATSIKGTTSVSPVVAGFPDLFTTTLSSSVKWFGTVRARLGYLPAEKLLVYLTGGFAFGETQLNFNTTEFTFAGNCSFGLRCANGSVSGVKPGWAAGAGVEGMIDPNWSIKAEYLRVDLGTQSVTAATNALPVGIIALTASRTLVENTVRVGLNHRFGGPVVAKY
jgi:outer membrane immunogenic protein